MTTKVAAPTADTVETTMSAQKLAGHCIGLFQKIADGSWNSEHWHALHEGRDPFAPPRTIQADVQSKVEWWRNHYQRLYRMNPDFSNLVIPKRQVGFDRLVIVAKGLTHNRWIEVARTIHEVSLYNDDLDAVVTKNDRDSKERSYGIWIRDRQEADEELMNKSANVLATEGVKGITLKERLVAGTGYLFQEYCHMDVENVTLCSSSRSSDGDVPSVYWDAVYHYLHVDWDFVGSRNSGLRARSVVS